MSIARGTVQLYRIRFWKNFDNIEVDLINGGRKTLHLSNYTYFPHINPELWEFKPQPTWMTQDENSLILTPPGSVSGEFDVLMTYDNRFEKYLILKVAKGDLIWTDQFGVAWTDSTGRAWGEKQQ